MVCFHPQLARLTKRYVDGKTTVKFVNNRTRLGSDGKVTYVKDPTFLDASGVKREQFYKYAYLPCGKCLGCRLDNSKNKAIRAMKHLMMHDGVGYFITLTYDDEKIKFYHGEGDDRATNLHKEDFVLFMKRLREYFPEAKLTYIHSGEYGDKKGRAHHHLILFGLDKFGDERFFTQRARHSRGTYRYATSEILDRLWRYGNCIISSVSYNTCRYVSSYILKKTLGKAAKAKLERENEYYTSSKGIGRSWFEKYYKDVFPSDELVYRDASGKYKSCKPDKYFMSLLEKIDADLYDEVKARRETKMLEHYHDDEREMYKRLSYSEAISLSKVYAKELQQWHSDLHYVFDTNDGYIKEVTNEFGIPLEFLENNEYLRSRYLKKD